MSNAIRNTKRKVAREHFKQRLRRSPKGLSGIIVYGAGCTWWDIIEAAADTRPPSCPFCGSVLFQFDSLSAFFAGADDYESKAHQGYRALLTWLQGKCFKTTQDAAIAYTAETGLPTWLSSSVTDIFAVDDRFTVNPSAASDAALNDD